MRHIAIAIIIVLCVGFNVAFTRVQAQSVAPQQQHNWAGFDTTAQPPSHRAPMHAAAQTAPYFAPQQPHHTPYENTAKSAPLSAIENAYAARLDETPRQFGYDIFNTDAHTASGANPPPMGAMQDDFVLGVGDELTITITGQRAGSQAYHIAPSGTLMLPDLPPIMAAGRTIAQFRSDLNAQLTTRPNTTAYVALSSLRQISVLVIGHVNQAGRKTLNVFHTVLDALNHAGGIQKDGSLRRIKLVRDGRSTYIDLYALLMHGAPHVDMRLKDGDRLIIPPIGPTVAVAGAVKRPAIYEIRQTRFGVNAHKHNNSEMLNANAMLDLAGGLITPADHRYMMMSVDPSGRDNIRQIDTMTTPQFGNGAILSVLKSEETRAGTIELNGHVRAAGLYDIDQHHTLASLLSTPDTLKHDVYPLLGIIERWDSANLATTYMPFPVRDVVQNAYDITLREGDVIHLFSETDIAYIQHDHSTAPTITQGSNPAQHRAHTAPPIIFEDPSLLSFVKERSIFIRGAVRQDGLYPTADGITLDAALAAAGGITLQGDQQRVEVTSKNFGTGHQTDGRAGTRRMTINLHDIPATDVILSAGDTVRVNQNQRQLTAKTVRIGGEVLHAGEYDLMAGDTLSSLLIRAGGLSAQAYAEGAIFSRAAERKVEEIRFRKQAQEMRHNLAAALESDKNRPNATQITMAQELAHQLETIEAVGRITVEADPAVLTVRPELDILLEKGDYIYIPKRPLTVRVSGEVLSPAALQFRDDKDPRDYIAEAGGYTYHADKDRAFVLYPDGSAEPLRVSAWNHNPIFIPPGATIIVPRDPKPFDFIESAKDISQILGNLAVTSVFIDDIRD